MFFKIGFLINFANFTGKQLCWCLFLIKLQTFRFLLKRDSTQVFSCQICEFANFLRTPFFTEHLQWLLLSLIRSVIVCLSGSQILLFSIDFINSVTLSPSFEFCFSNLSFQGNSTIHSITTFSILFGNFWEVLRPFSTFSFLLIDPLLSNISFLYGLKTSKKWVFCRFQLVSQPEFTCSKLSIETLEQGVKYVES